MNVNDLSSRIQDVYRVQLVEFRAKLFGPEGHTGAHNEFDSSWQIPGFGAVQSLLDPFAKVTIGADRADVAWLLEKPALVGQCVTVSVAGHHNVLDRRISLDDGEYVAWVQAILGVAWMPFVYRAGGIADFAGRPITTYFRLFLDSDGRPCFRPDEYEDADLELVES